MSLLDARDLPPGTRLHADVVVAGSGPAGTSLALELSRAGVEVVLLEGGGLRADGEVQEDLAGDGPSQQVERLDRVREKRLGGTSHRWGGRTYPFDPSDLEDSAGGGRDAWPITYEELEPYLRRAAALLDLRRYEWTAAQAIDGAPSHLLGPGRDPVVADEAIWRWSPPTNFARVVRTELVPLPHVRVLHHATVTGLHLQGGHVSSVTVTTAPGRTVEVIGRDVVLALGGIETARLLLHTGVGTENDQVGRHLMIHPVAEVGRLRLLDPQAGTATATFVKSRDGVWVRRLLQLQDAVRRREGLLNMGMGVWYVDPRDPSHGDALLSSFALARQALHRAGGFKSTGMHARYASAGDTRAHLRNVARDVPGLAAFSLEWARDRWLDPRTRASFTRVSPTGEYRIRFDAEQSADPANRVTLSDELDRLGVPRVVVTHQVSQSDRANYHRSLQLLGEALQNSTWARFDPPTPEVLQRVPLVDATHQMGTVRMGADPRSSVCDPHQRVWSSTNLHLSSSGVFRTAGMAGPTLTLVATSLRLADHLVRQRRNHEPSTPGA